MIQLPLPALVALVAEVGQGLVVDLNHEVSYLQHLSKVFYSLVNCQQFSVRRYISVAPYSFSSKSLEVARSILSIVATLFRWPWSRRRSPG